MSADLILLDARIFTADRVNPWAEALVVSEGRLVHVGDRSGALAWEGPNTDVHSLDGAFLMPGIVDGHNHPSSAGRTALFELALSPTASVDELLETIRGHAAQLPPGSWINGAGWDIGLLDALDSVTVLGALDEAAGGRPAVLVDVSRHNRWVSSRAMELAGVANRTDGGILRGAEGAAATGVLLERAGLPVAHAFRRQSGLSPAQEQESYLHGLHVLHSYGVTAFQDAGATLETVRALHALDADARLDAWVVSSMLMNDDVFGAELLGEPLLDQAEAFRSEHHRPDFVKIFLDGIPPARTAAMLEPYLPDDQHGCGFCGSTILTAEELHGTLVLAAERGLGAKIHCTGDAATRLVLDTVERLRGEGYVDTRFQIAHGQFVAEEDIPRFAELGVHADISPYVWYPGPLSASIKAAVPAPRAEQIHPNRKLIDAGVLVAAGSDWPVSPIPNPWEAVGGLVTRTDPTGRYPGSLWPEQALTVLEALEVVTVNSADMIGVSDVTGSLTVGKSADFIVIDRDPFEAAPETLGGTLVMQTWFAGKPVFLR